MDLAAAILLILLNLASRYTCSDSRLVVKMTLVHNASKIGGFCLDGSLPAYHLHRGFGAGARNWLLQFEDQKTWVPAYDDDDFCLRFIWSRPSKLSPQSYATIEWRIPQSAVSGVYRIRHFGAAKALLGSISHFTGSSSAFVVA